MVSCDALIRTAHLVVGRKSLQIHPRAVWSGRECQTITDLKPILLSLAKDTQSRLKNGSRDHDRSSTALRAEMALRGRSRGAARNALFHKFSHDRSNNEAVKWPNSRRQLYFLHNQLDFNFISLLYQKAKRSSTKVLYTTSRFWRRSGSAPGTA